MAKKSRKKDYVLFANKESGVFYIARANTNLPKTLKKYDKKLRKHVSFGLKK